MVHSRKSTNPSASALENWLERAGYNGPPICWGVNGDGFNGNAIYNKREALEIMAEADVPTPRVMYEMPQYPCVGRRDYHRKGRGFFKCETEQDYKRTRRFKRPPSHYLEWIEAEKEFRVHVAFGQAIKLSDKNPIGNFENGAIFTYPTDFKHKRELKEVGVAAVEALELDFGAVDIMWTDSGGFYVLEVNTAPCLTNEKSDTLERYATAFINHPEARAHKAPRPAPQLNGIEAQRLEYLKLLYNPSQLASFATEQQRPQRLYSVLARQQALAQSLNELSYQRLQSISGRQASPSLRARLRRLI